MFIHVIMEGKRGQISTEYLIVVGFITFLVISVLGAGLFYSSQISDRIKINQLTNFANKVISSSNSVFFAGEPSRVVINAYLPPGISDLEVLQNEIVFNVSTSSGITRISFSSKVPISGVISNSEGVKRIQIAALSDKIILSEG